jgi:hypothetical protein
LVNHSFLTMTENFSIRFLRSIACFNSGLHSMCSLEDEINLYAPNRISTHRELACLFIFVRAKNFLCMFLNEFHTVLMDHLVIRVVSARSSTYEKNHYKTFCWWSSMFLIDMICENICFRVRENTRWCYRRDYDDVKTKRYGTNLSFLLKKKLKLLNFWANHRHH